MTQDTKTVRVRISGSVQGVWYRGWTVREATRLGLKGWVRNLIEDDDVEALFHGPIDAVNKMVEKCWSGPAGARVDSVDQSDSQETPDSGFIQRPTI